MKLYYFVQSFVGVFVLELFLKVLDFFVGIIYGGVVEFYL